MVTEVGLDSEIDVVLGAIDAAGVDVVAFLCGCGAVGISTVDFVDDCVGVVVDAGSVLFCLLSFSDVVGFVNATCAWIAVESGIVTICVV
ncbi:hypothetical protein LSP04_14990 [Levilactobacillus spicheri]|uniref:Uncharacterized protein n=1 Tax=Levilactobacillus spicheri TaxID=216463 RepID=A0ABQ0WRA5_9LACO|nr:hypothetical protein LSP04_14990 [Levilactobacillus spicheri]